VRLRVFPGVPAAEAVVGAPCTSACSADARCAKDMVNGIVIAAAGKVTVNALFGVIGEGVGETELQVIEQEICGVVVLFPVLAKCASWCCCL
jgi:hypothetical protein